MGRTDLSDTNDLLIDEGGVLIPGVKDSDYSVTLVFRKDVTASTGLHWHEEKDEYLQVLQGHALVTIGDRTAVFGPDDGPITIPRMTLHQFRRADDTPEGAVSKDIDLLIKEWTNPPDFAKEIFFRNMLGVIIDRETGLIGNLKTLLSLFVIMKEHDNYPVMTQGPSFLGQQTQALVRRWVTYTTLGTFSLVGHLFGLKASYNEYMPEHLRKKQK